MPVFALIDGNNFYASCERTFNAALRGKPVVVLSNNDGCVIAQSAEVKALGLEIGQPYFEIEDLLKAHGVQVFSSNYSLYGDMSRRMMEVLSGFTDRMEVYSIDEAFLSMDHVGPEHLEETGREIRERVLEWTGIPVGVGFGTSKTLAKLANRTAKKTPSSGGVMDFVSHSDLDEVLSDIPVEKVWGIGRRRAAFLRSHGIRTVLGLKRTPEAWAKKQMGVTGLRTVLELRGVSCLPLEQAPPARASVTCSRSFGRPVMKLEELKEAVACYVSQAAERMRRGKQAARVIQVYIHTSKHYKGQRYANSATFQLPAASNYTPELIAHAHRLLEKIYRPGYPYAKAGVNFLDLAPEEERQLSLFETPEEMERRHSLMKALDKINEEAGEDRVHFAAQGLEREWHMRREHRSPRYTTRWDELLEVKADSGSWEIRE